MLRHGHEICDGPAVIGSSPDHDRFYSEQAVVQRAHFDIVAQITNQAFGIDGDAKPRRHQTDQGKRVAGLKVGLQGNAELSEHVFQPVSVFAPFGHVPKNHRIIRDVDRFERARPQDGVAFGVHDIKRVVGQGEIMAVGIVVRSNQETDINLVIGDRDFLRLRGVS